VGGRAVSYQGTRILGTATALPEQMDSTVRRVNPDAPDLIRLYLRLGPQLGVRGDLALAQAIHETDYFRYGGSVKPEQNNYGGIGATGPDQAGASFSTPEEGVLAHLQHLYAYASTDPLPDGMAKIDPRFDLVQRASARFIGELNGKWAVPGTGYGESVDRILGQILMRPATAEPYAITESYLEVTSQNRPGPCTDSGCWQGVSGIVVHRTASPSMDARAIRNYFNQAPDRRFASSQFVVDNTAILQLMPIGEVAYHTAGRNQSYLGIETCEHNWGTETWPETYRKLVWLTGYLVRAFGLNVGNVTGHFWWDPVNRPYDPTHLGWSPAEGKATGVFEWNQFIADVREEVKEAIAPKPVDVHVRKTIDIDCTKGLLINSTTYVPIRPYTSCLAPDASINWDPNGPAVVVDLPFASGAKELGSPATEGAKPDQPKKGLLARLLGSLRR